ncbi:MAG: DUF1651 domain-containing protein [Cyanobacteriota bacterium]|nr:DUF1651 domain-containing protein [Cyanobacteriota bacterium]
MTPAGEGRPPSPREAWLRAGPRVLHFRPARWDRWRQSLEVTSGEWIDDQSSPLLKHRQELCREDALALWLHLRREGWEPCPPQWQPPGRSPGRR